MMKDRNLKMDLVKYFLRRYWYPQLEVDVLSNQRIDKSKKVITDIDVLGLYTNSSGLIETILGDCKTQKNQSPIARTLWMRGLLDYFHAEKGIVILSKEIEKEHQSTSNSIGVHLFSEVDFKTYSTHTADYLNPLQSALAVSENWDEFFDIQNKFPRLTPLMLFSKSEFWNENLANNRLRHSISTLRSVRGELNPSNNAHLAVVLNHFSLIAIALNDIINKIFNRYLVPSTKPELDDDLKMIIWGGVENYEYLNYFKKKFAASSTDEDLTLPNWEGFIEFIRYTLEKPLSFFQLALFLKEVSFSLLSPSSTFTYSKEISKTHVYTTAFAIKLSEYMCKASNLPSDFHDTFSAIFI